MQEALDSGKNLTARDEARRLREAIRCLDEVLPDPTTAAQVARAIGAGYVAADELALGKPWLRSALDLEDYRWPLDEDHPVVIVWRALAEEPRPEIVRSSDRGFSDVARLDGSPLAIPRARPDRPHILQIGENPTDTFVIYGERFPGEVLGGASPTTKRSDARRTRDDRRVAGTVQNTAPAPIAGSEVAMPNPEEPLVVRRLRPPEKTPLLVAGATLTVVAGGLYGLAAQRRARFNDREFATSLDEITALRSQVNGLVLASAATFALGAGGVTWGTLVDARGTATLRVRF